MRHQRSDISRLAVALVCSVCAAPALAEDQADAMRFVPVAVYVDPGGEPLAAYQFELKADPSGGASGARIVGLEGGDHPAFDDPTYYDPEAMRGERVFAAAFSTNPPNKLPTTRTRVATVHIAVPADVTPKFDVTLQAAADHEGKKIDATITTQTQTPSEEKTDE